jgi:hypothetical protein
MYVNQDRLETTEGCRPVRENIMWGIQMGMNKFNSRDMRILDNGQIIIDSPPSPC